jgi:hypothetical protein
MSSSGLRASAVGFVPVGTGERAVAPPPKPLADREEMLPSIEVASSGSSSKSRLKSQAVRIGRSGRMLGAQKKQGARRARDAQVLRLLALLDDVERLLACLIAVCALCERLRSPLQVVDSHPALADKGLCRPMVDGSQGRDLAEELIENRLGDRRLWERYRRPIGQDDGLGRARVGREQAPVHVSAIADVGRVAVLRRRLENLLDNLLALVGLLEEQLDDGRQRLELDRIWLFLEGPEEGAEELVGIVNLVGVLADDPDERGLGLGRLELLEV